MPEVALTPNRWTDSGSVSSAWRYQRRRLAQSFVGWGTLGWVDGSLLAEPRCSRGSLGCVAPIRNLGLVIVDEHEPAFKQDETLVTMAGDVAIYEDFYQSLFVFWVQRHRP